jgi:phosphoribosyl 1,2-cyclic phosphodiesterase
MPGENSCPLYSRPQTVEAMTEGRKGRFSYAVLFINNPFGYEFMPGMVAIPEDCHSKETVAPYIFLTNGTFFTIGADDHIPGNDLIFV